MNTNLYSDLAFNLINDAINYARANGYYREYGISYYKFSGHHRVERDPDNSICVKNKYDYSSLNNIEVARLLKGIYKVKSPAKDFSYKNDDFVVFGENSYQVKALYFIYEFLLGHKYVKNHFTSDFISEIVGVARDPISTEIEIARRAEEKNIREEYKKKIEKCEFNDVYHYAPGHLDSDSVGYEIQELIKELNNRLHLKWDTKKAELMDEMNQKIEDLNKSFAA